jgi:molybdate transport system ATP-binding protein
MSLSVDIAHRLGQMELRVGFETAQGVTALFGRSGAGKTSVANAVAGLLRPDQGQIRLGDRVLFDRDSGVDVPVHKRRIGYVFQEARLFPHLTVRGNLLYGAPDDAGLGRICDLLGIAPLLTRRPRALSGGEKARVAIGRALLSAPDLLIMDEPLAALDVARKAEILPYLERLRDEAGLPILYVSHAVDEVARLATSLVLMDQGRVVGIGPAQDMLADPALAPQIGPGAAGAVLTGRLVAHHDDGLSEVSVGQGALFLPHVGGAVGHDLRVRVEAKDVMIALTRPEAVSALNILPAVVGEVRPGQGPGAMVQLISGQDRILARVTQRSVAALGLQAGQSCFAVIKSVSVAPRNIGHHDVGHGVLASQSD